MSSEYFGLQYITWKLLGEPLMCASPPSLKNTLIYIKICDKDKMQDIYVMRNEYSSNFIHQFYHPVKKHPAQMSPGKKSKHILHMKP